MKPLLIFLLLLHGESWLAPTPALLRRQDLHRVYSSSSSSSSFSPKVHATTATTPAREEVERAVGSLAATTLALLTGDEAAAKAVAGGAAEKRATVLTAMSAFDFDKSGTLSAEEATALFSELSRSIVKELAAPDSRATAVAPVAK